MRAFLFGLVAVLFAATSSASLVTSAMTGRVRSEGLPAAGVTVTASSPLLQAPRSTTTSRRGTWWIGSIPPGAYEVTFSGPGLQSLTRRVVVELARVARADASLEPSEDEESVTSTVRNIAVTDTTAITTHFDDSTLDRLPLRRDATTVADTAPGGADDPLLFAGGIVAHTSLLGEEAVEQITVIRGAPPIEYDRYGSSVVVGQLRSGRTAPYLSLRGTLSHDEWMPGERSVSGKHGLRHLLETASGGRLFGDRLSLFAAGWSGDDASAGLSTLRGLTFNAAAQLSPSHNIGATWIDSTANVDTIDASTSVRAIRYTGVSGAFVTQAVASRSENDLDVFSRRDDLIAARTAFRISDHVISAGFDAWNTSDEDRASVFLADRWSARRWTVDAGVRHEIGDSDGHTAPRIALTWDLLGNGRRALTGSHGHYLDEAHDDSRLVRSSSLGFASAIGMSGTARVDIIRRSVSGVIRNGVEGEARYRMFDRFEAGGNYTWFDRDSSTELRHKSNLWLGAAFPFRDRDELGVTLLYRFRDEQLRSHVADLGLRYALPVRRMRLTVAADVLDLMDDVGGRAWVRLTM
ncbi:MAG TPA: TonB-dependent receptor [Thermoanaerobaculia bacterium]